MKKILLSSAAIAAFAGAAAAEVTFSGSAQLGYNDTEVEGLYADADLDIKMSQELDNGWTASLTYGVELEDLNKGVNQDFNADNNVLFSLTSDSYGIYYGNTDTAANSLWTGAGDMANDGFSEQDAEEVLKATANVAGVEAAVSTIIEPATNEDAQTSVAAKGTFGNYTVGVAYQEEGDVLSYAAGDQEDYNSDELYGLFASTSFAGAEVTAAYASNETTGEDSFGLEVAYPVGDVTIGAFYVAESLGDDSYGVSADYAAGAFAVSAFYEDVQGVEDGGVEGSYDLGNGLVVYAGYIDSTEGYVGAEYDLGGGASIIASYADQDEEGEKEYDEGTSLILNLKF
ncbi:porin-like protein [Pacificibacter maritimus]|uniref:Porin-like protein n=1 Tax=Pacificibacter maritimus TaxID=762213 RepID=A0A3N4U908_9RHOB|nr:porin [Pacificibacter maritimus]RPE64845.1 porin-like protein [Pacificibacter maritimus]